MAFSKNLIRIDPEAVTRDIAEKLRRSVGRHLHKRGAVIGLSGGIDSSVTLALCVRAFGPEKILGLALPESESSPESTRLAQELASRFNIRLQVENLTPVLEGFHSYARRDEAIRKVFPEFGEGHTAKIILPGDLMEKETLNVFQLKITAPGGEEKTRRIPLQEYLQIVAASNFKQRCRMSLLYYHAERLNYAVIGTGNKNEHEQGFFVKYGDGGADVKPIAHLYKTQIYQLAEHLEIPRDIRERIPTTDTYSSECTQEEFFFRVPFEVGDLAWLAMERGYSAAEAAAALDLTEEQVYRIQNDIRRKLKTAEYLKSAPLHLVEPGPETS